MATTLSFCPDLLGHNAKKAAVIENLREILDETNRACRSGIFDADLSAKQELVEQEFAASSKLYVYGTLGPDQPNKNYY